MAYVRHVAGIGPGPGLRGDEPLGAYCERTNHEMNAVIGHWNRLARDAREGQKPAGITFAELMKLFYWPGREFLAEQEAHDQLRRSADRETVVRLVSTL